MTWTFGAGFLLGGGVGLVVGVTIGVLFMAAAVANARRGQGEDDKGAGAA